MKQKEQAQALADDWYKRAQLALQKGNEELAREALSRKQQNADQAETLQQQIDRQAASIDKLYEGMQTLEKKILESKSKKDEMVARARTAQSTQKGTYMLTVESLAGFALDRICAYSKSIFLFSLLFQIVV